MELIPCTACKNSISPKAPHCPKCGHPVASKTQKIVVSGWGYGWEYKSGIKIFGLPLIHLASGFDIEKGRKRVARGIIAIGDIAIGLVSIGGVALGGVTLGGVSLGLVAIGGLALGGFAVGGIAIGYVAIGGAALGYYALGGGAFGKHVFGALKQDPEAVKFFLENLGIELPLIKR